MVEFFTQAKIFLPRREEVGNLLPKIGLLLHYLTYTIAYWLPNFSLRTLLKCIVGEKKHVEIWNKLPLKRFKSLIMLPDCNKLIYSWEYGREVKYIVHEIYNWQVYDRFFTPLKSFIVVDVGAHFGIYTVKAAKKVGVEGLVIAVEAENGNYKFLNRNIRINRYRNVIPLKLALSSFEGQSKLYVRSFGGHSLVRKTNDAIDVSVTTLAKLLSRIGVNRVDLMKIDVEGAELEVLKGAEELLNSKKIFRIVIAAYHSQTQAEGLTRYLTAFDYEVKLLTLDKTLTKDNKFLYAQCDFIAK